MASGTSPKQSNAEPGTAAVPRRRRARNYWAHDDLRDMVHFPRLKPLPYLQESRLIERAQEGDTDARNTVWRHHLRLTYGVINQFHVPRKMLPDALQEAAIGLERAIMRFEVHRYVAFSTYAWFWISQRVQRFLRYHRYCVRIPDHLHRSFIRFCIGRDRCATPSEWFDWREGWSGLDPDKYHLTLSMFQLVHAEPVTRQTYACDELSGPDLSLLAAERDALVREAIATLPERVGSIIIGRYGLDGEPEQTLEEIAQKLGLTRERIRQIQAAGEILLRKAMIDCGAAQHLPGETDEDAPCSATQSS